MSSMDNPIIKQLRSTSRNMSHWNSTITNETEICIRYGVEVVTFPLYRAMLCMQIGFCISSLFLLLLVLTKYQQKLIFPYDVRALFISLSLASLLHACVVAFFDSYQLVLSFTYTTPCDVFLPRFFYASFHLPLMFSILWIEASQIVMLFGRFLTTFSLIRLEKHSKRSGNVMLFASLFIPLMGVLALYLGESFDVPQINVLNTPQTLTDRINMMFISFIILNTIGLPALITMHIYSKRKSKRAEGLSNRFQCTQEVNSSLLIITLTALQIIVFFTYAVCMFYLRMTFQASTDSLALFKSKIIAGYLVHLHTLLLPVVTIIFLWRMRQERRSTIKSMVQVKSNGAEGWANYANQLNQQWY